MVGLLAGFRGRTSKGEFGPGARAGLQAAGRMAVGKDGSLFVSDDGSKSIWRVSYGGK